MMAVFKIVLPINRFKKKKSPYDRPFFTKEILIHHSRKSTGVKNMIILNSI